MNDIQRLIAKDLLKIKAVFFRPNEPFTWASGIKSPVYCDNRLTLTAPEVRNDVENALALTIKANYPSVEVLMGTSTAGIAHAAITGHIMGLPMGYVRSGAKDHGRQNQIEGRLEKGQKVVVVEDLISTGGSVIEVVNVLREAGADVLGIVSIFTYGMKKGLDRLAEANVKNISLTNFDCIAEIAAEEGYIAKEDIAKLIAFRNNPSDESWMEDNSMKIFKAYEQIDKLFDENNTENITLIDFNGNPMEFEQIAIIPLDVNHTYAILMPITPVTGVEEGESLLFEILEFTDELKLVSDQNIINRAMKIYQDLIDND